MWRPGGRHVVQLSQTCAFDQHTPQLPLPNRLICDEAKPLLRPSVFSTSHPGLAIQRVLDGSEPTTLTDVDNISLPPGDKYHSTTSIISSSSSSSIYPSLCSPLSHLVTPLFTSS